MGVSLTNNYSSPPQSSTGLRLDNMLHDTSPQDCSTANPTALGLDYLEPYEGPNLSF